MKSFSFPLASALLLGALAWTPAQGVMTSFRLGAVPLRTPDSLGWQHVVWQRDANTCGPAVIAMILRRARQETVSVSEVSARGRLTAQGIHLEGFERLARQFGIRGTWRDGAGVRQAGELPSPSVVLMGSATGHYVLVERAFDQHVLVSDPLAGRQLYPWKAFQAAWAGPVFALEGITWPLS